MESWNRITHFRPHLKEFLDYCEFRFDKKVVWSTGGEDHVSDNVRAMEKMSCVQIDAVLSKEDTKFSKEQPFGDKCLDKVYRLLPTCTERNTFIVDDNASNFKCDPRNGILIPPFSPSHPAVFNIDYSLLQLKEWMDLSKVIECRDVRELDKSRIFG